MLGVLKAAGFEQTRERDGGEVEVRLAIGSSSRYLDRVDDRDHVAVVASLRPFFAPRSVAVIGASARRGTIGGELFRNIIAGDFSGAAYPVNARGEPVSGVAAYQTIEAVPEVVDLAVIAVPGHAVLDAASCALRTGVRALCVISAGFAEFGVEGTERQERLLEVVRAHGGRMVGPNCLGIAVSGARLNATFGPPHIPAGNIGFSSQSGALGLAFLQEAASRGLGLSAFVSIGNKADVSSNDLLEHWEDDESTELILLYLESFGNPRRFGRIARRVARRKPILAMKSGRSRAGARASASHTAALAGSEEAVDALFEQAGVIRADTVEQLLDVASLLATQPLTQGHNVVVVSNAGGLGIVCADACEAAGLELPELTEATQAALATRLPPEASRTNPVDLLGSATGATYETVLPVVLADPRVDAVIVLFVPPVVAGAQDVAEAIRRAVDDLETLDKPLLAVIMSSDGTPQILRDGTRPLATFGYPESAAAALGRAAARSDWLRRPAGTVPSSTTSTRRPPAPSSPLRSATRRISGSSPRRRAGCSRPTACRSWRSTPSRLRRKPSPSRPSLDFPSSSRRRPRESTRRNQAESHSTCATNRRSALRSPASGCPRSSSRWCTVKPSCSPAWCRTTCSARSSRSAPAACSRSSSATRRSASRP